jgi:hypothetical protein
MCTTRDIEGEGFGSKNNRWRQWVILYKTREGLAKHINMALEKAGLPQRVTHKSYADLGIDREPTKHVGPEHSGNRDASYRAKREERLRNNRRVKVVNQQRGKRRAAAARKCLIAGAQGAKLMAVVRDQLKDARQLDAVPVTPAMSSEALVAYNQLHTVLSDADEIYLAVGRVRTGLGREWNWQAMAAQYNRVDKPGGDVLTALLVKELIWVVSRSPEQAPEFAKLVPRTRLAEVAVAAKTWALGASKPDALHLIVSILQTAGIGVANGLDIQAVVSTGNSALPDFSNYADALAPLAYLIADMRELVGVCQRVAHSIEKKISPDILAKRVNRILATDTWPTTQAELLDALVAGEVVFAAKRRQHKLAEVLDAVPSDRRSHFEAMITSVLGGCTVDAGHAMASRALSQQAQMEVQAECNLRMVLSEFQLSDFDCRRQAMAALGKTYTWSDFQHDIQRQSGTDSGWQRAWWDEQIDNLTGTPLASFLKTMPPWYAKSTPPKPKSYPLGSYDPHPQKTWLSALNTHLAMHPTVLASDAKDTLAPPHANDYEVDRLGAVMAPAPILEVKTCNPWGGRVNQSGGRNLRGSETPYSNGW